MIGVVVSHDHRRWADSLAEGLPELLREQVDADANWSIGVEEADPADASASPSDMTADVLSLLESDEAVREATYRRTPGRDGSQVADED
jgi:hypothetical protein